MFASPRSELLALLAAIKAEPEENTPKLALADWLQEQPSEADQARGAFLHQFVQNNLLAKADPARQDFGALSRLWNAHEREWAGALKSARLTVWATNHMFRWGLLFPALDATHAALARASEVAGTEEYAWVAGLAVRAVDPAQIPLLVNSPLLDSLIALKVGPAEGRAALLSTLANSPRAAGLQELDVGGPVFTQGQLQQSPLAALAQSPYLAGLRRLTLRESEIEADDLAALCSSRTLTALRALDLSGADLGADAGRVFAQSTGLPALTELNLGRVAYRTNRLGDSGLITLIANPRVGRLQRLSLASNEINDTGASALCVQAHMCNLTHLDLSGNCVPDRIIGELANAEHLKTLEYLNLSANSIANTGANALARSPYLNNLRRLDLTNNRFGVRAKKALRDRFGAAVLLS